MVSRAARRSAQRKWPRNCIGEALEGFLRSMSTINSYPTSAALAAIRRHDSYLPGSAGGWNTSGKNTSFEEAINDAAQAPQGEAGATAASLDSVSDDGRRPVQSAPKIAVATPASPSTDGPHMMPMQQSWVAPVVPATPSAYPLHPVYGVPMVSEATLNRYIHPLQTVGTTSPGPAEAPGDIGTSVFRVAPGGMQDFVTADGYRHRFDVEIVFPSPSTFTWQERDATEIHPEVADFAANALREKMASSGMDVAKLEITPFRMKGGNAARPWFLDQLVLKMAGKPDLPVSLNVAMRDPAYTLETIQAAWDLGAAPSAIPS